MPRNNKNNNRSSNYINRNQPEEPITFPELVKKLRPLDQDSISKNIKKDIGKYSITLMNLSQVSIYKKLFNKFGNLDLNFRSQELKNIRNTYLKKLVESNPDNFPIELSLDEYKEMELSKEDKVNNILEKLKEASKNEKIKPQKEINKQLNKNIRKESIDEKIEKKNKKQENKGNKKEEKNNPYQDSPNNFNEDDNSDNKEQSYEEYEDEEKYINDNEDDSQNNNMGDDDDYDEGGVY